MISEKTASNTENLDESQESNTDENPGKYCTQTSISLQGIFSYYQEFFFFLN